MLPVEILGTTHSRNTMRARKVLFTFLLNIGFFTNMIVKSAPSIATPTANSPSPVNLGATGSQQDNKPRSITSQNKPQIKFKQTIVPDGVDLGSRVKQLAFSPDGRYLAILCNPDLVHGLLVIWDMEADREQARIMGLSASLGNNLANKIIWSHDGSYITFGISHNKAPRDPSSPWQISLWNPMTGEKIKDVNVYAGYSSLNRNGTKLLAASGTLAHPTFRIYDTQTWEFNEYEGDGIQLATGALCWTAEDKVLAIGHWDKNYKGQVLDGVKNMDVLARLIDPSGKQPSHTILLSPSLPTNPPSQQFVQRLTPRWNSIDYIENKIAIGWGTIKVLNGESLETVYTYTPDAPEQGAYGAISFSPDGNYLFIMDARTVGEGQSVILDAQTGQRIGSFPSGTQGFAVSPSGKMLALGNEGTVKIFSVE